MDTNLESNKRIWIVPNNDLEAKAIISLLEKNGEDFIVTGQGWGASWDMLEPKVLDELKRRGFEIKEEDIMALGSLDTEIAELSYEINKLEAQENKEEVESLKEKRHEIINNRIK